MGNVTPVGAMGVQHVTRLGESAAQDGRCPFYTFIEANGIETARINLPARQLGCRNPPIERFGGRKLNGCVDFALKKWQGACLSGGPAAP